MASVDQVSRAVVQPDDAHRRTGRVRGIFAGARELVRIAYRDPEHVVERLTLYGSDRLAEESSQWVRAVRDARPDAPRARIAEELRAQTAQITRLDGAISGTPFFIALVPGYLTYLWQEMRMTLRIAALYDRDPGSPQTAAETLALRGVHADVKTAQAALTMVRNMGTPEPPKERRSLRTWIRSIYALLVFGGFISASKAKPRSGARGRVMAMLSLTLATAIWVTTFILPVTFMIVMAWGCESHARELGRRALVYYDGEEATAAAAIARAEERRERGRLPGLRAVALFLSVAIPIAIIALAIHFQNSTNVHWLAALGALAAVSLVIATVVISNRRQAL